MIEVTIKISDVDYSSAADTLMPILVSNLADSAHPLAGSILRKLKGASAKAVKAALSLLPKEMQDELVAACINHYQEEIVKQVVKMANKQNIQVQVEGLEVTVVKESV